MRLSLRHISACLILIAAVVGFSGHVVHAEGLFGYNLFWDFISEGVALLVNVMLSITSWFVALTGTLLNVSINLTMHIRDFVDSTPAIYEVWRTIRDISGLFIIFTLLYAAIRMILGQDAKLGGVIKNVVVAGVLINFSFFFTGLLIDASNIVSLQLYKAITPGQPDIGQIIQQSGSGSGAAGAGALPQIVNTLFNDGGLSAIFMQSLQIQSAFDPKNLQSSDATGGVSAPFKIILIGWTGAVIMITTGLSFLFAALAFVVRLVILLFLLAFSPVWCAAAVIPQLKEYSNEWVKTFTGQLVFMPAYLLLMYAALLILTKSTIFKSGAYGNLWQGTDAGTLVPTEFVSFAINAVFVIVMLNLPLLVAIKLGAKTGGLLDGSKLGADALWKKVGGWTGRNTLGMAASRINDSDGARAFYSRNPNLGLAVSKGLSNISSAGFGDKKGSYDATLKQRKKDVDALNKRLGSVNDAAYKTELERELAKGRAKGYQGKFRSTLNDRSVLTLMMKDRANVETAFSLKDEAELEQNKKAKQDIEESPNFKYLEKREKEGGDTFTNAEKVELDQLRRKVKDLGAAIGRASGKKKAKDVKALASALAEEGKDDSKDDAKPKDDKPKA
ncbi:MAG: hypothetical protein AAB365_03350 [Patescibacteria group bacterium]